MGNKLERLYTPVVNIWSGATPLPTVAGSFFVHFSKDNSLRRTVVMVLPFFFTLTILSLSIRWIPL